MCCTQLADLPQSAAELRVKVDQAVEMRKTALGAARKEAQEASRAAASNKCEEVLLSAATFAHTDLRMQFAPHLSYVCCADIHGRKAITVWWLA